MESSLEITITPNVNDHRNRVVGVRGLMRYDGKAITIEYQTTSNTVEFGEPNTVTIPLDGIAGVEHRKSLLGSRLTVHATSLRYLDGVPGARGSQLVVRTSRRNREQASRMAWDIQTALENRKLPTP